MSEYRIETFKNSKLQMNDYYNAGLRLEDGINLENRRWKLNALYPHLRISRIRDNYIVRDFLILEKLRKLDLFVDKLFKVADKYNYVLFIVSGWRTDYINSMVKGSINSQHIYLEAIDFQLFKANKPNPHVKKAQDWDRLYYDDVVDFYDILEKELGDIICQMYHYSWGIHVSMYSQDINRVIERGRGGVGNWSKNDFEDKKF